LAKIKQDNFKKLPTHPYHIVNPSPWPFFVAVDALVITLGAVMYFHNYKDGGWTLIYGLGGLILLLIAWWRDVVIEATFLGYHTLAVQKSLRIGFILFIFSEVMFFVSFFWAFFHLSIDPSVFIGAIWPPEGIVPFNAYAIPLLNTYILLLSGATITYTHYSLIAGNKSDTFFGFSLTLLLGLIFSGLQLYEYIVAPFSISDGVYGSTFFMITGLHGSHVIVGTIFIAVCFIRTYFSHFTRTHHLGFEFAVWYWHFVDVVWLFVYTFIYLWGSL